jgi:predicted DsbA family dithiol-disulfide isomerase
LHDLMFAHQAQLDAQQLQKSVSIVGLDPEKLSACLGSEASRLVGADEAAGGPLGVTGTPTFFVGVLQADGRVLLKQRLSGAQPVVQFQTVLEKWLADVPSGRP